MKLNYSYVWVKLSSLCGTPKFSDKMIGPKISNYDALYMSFGPIIQALFFVGTKFRPKLIGLNILYDLHQKKLINKLIDKSIVVIYYCYY